MYLQHLPTFLMYFGLAAFSMLAFTLIYIKLTPYNELQEIRDNHNKSAAIALSGALIGFALPEASLLIHSVNVSDFLAWSIVAIFVQLFAFIVSFVFKVQKRVAEQDISAGIMLASISIVAGILNAACMTY